MTLDEIAREPYEATDGRVALDRCPTCGSLDFDEGICFSRSCPGRRKTPGERSEMKTWRCLQPGCQYRFTYTKAPGGRTIQKHRREAHGEAKEPSVRRGTRRGGAALASKKRLEREARRPVERPPTKATRRRPHANSHCPQCGGALGSLKTLDLVVALVKGGATPQAARTAADIAIDVLAK